MYRQLLMDDSVRSLFLGGERQNTKTPEHQNTKTPKHQNTKTPKHQNTKTPRPLDQSITLVPA
ncbi:hypothetical protein BVG16_10330 [Paenibacillus selenitireducens]|uniref:Uncharacterized protein n=1 Tax=Paenibacillus selenitireducens TaxID=1324314 RepID=A0A1T2XHU2_9BACL|nr:hypothetical protein BVG16_10330 [Paenibacillus selenitireducens]